MGLGQREPHTSGGHLSHSKKWSVADMPSSTEQPGAHKHYGFTSMLYEIGLWLHHGDCHPNSAK